jgi:hypothetical protein
MRKWMAPIVCVMGVACGSSTTKSSTGGTGPVNSPCLENTDCASGICEQFGEGYCGQSCATAACPQGLTCGTGSDGMKECVRPCHSGDALSSGNVSNTCLNGLPVNCNVAPPSQCMDCGCSDNTTMYCMAGVGCMSKGPIGSACSTDNQCADGYCAVGTPTGVCSKQNCDSDSQCPAGAACVTWSCGSSICGTCLATCEAEADASTEAGVGTCAVGTCRALGHDTPAGGSVQVCDPRGATGACTQTNQCLSYVCQSGTCEPQVGIGGPCTLDTECLSGYCGSNITPNVCAQSFGDPCTSNDECGNGIICCLSALNPANLHTCQLSGSHC